MKKFSLIYAFSFLPYLAYNVFWFYYDNVDKSPHSYKSFVYIFAFLMIFAFIYQLIYIMKLGRKDNASAKKCAGQFFLYLLLSQSISVIINYISIYYNGYIGRAFISGRGTTYYKTEAWDKYSSSWFFPKQTIFFSVLYAIIYFIVCRICKKRKEEMAELGIGEKAKSNRKITFLTVLPLIVMFLVVIFGAMAAKNKNIVS